eukprot:931548-Prymnesium_polylepis.1
MAGGAELACLVWQVVLASRLQEAREELAERAAELQHAKKAGCEPRAPLSALRARVPSIASPSQRLAARSRPPAPGTRHPARGTRHTSP